MQYNITYREKDGGIQVVVNYKIDGKWKQKCKQGFKKKSLAKIAADNIVNDLKEISIYNMDFNNSTISELQKLYLEHSRLHNAYNTYINKVDGLKRFDLDEIVINDLKRNDVQLCINKLLKAGYSQSTIVHSLSILKAFLSWVSLHYEVRLICLKGVSIPRVTTCANSKKSLEPFQINDLVKLYEGKKSYSLNYYIAILLGCKAGLRAGEMMALTWGDIDFKKNMINIDKQLKRGPNGIYVTGDLKSKNSYRAIPMSTFLSSELKKIKKEFPLNLDNRLISIKNTVTLTVNLDKQLKSLYSISMHELRHTFATDLIANGIDFKTAAAILGHDVKETMDTYSHVTDAMMDKAKLIIQSF